MELIKDIKHIPVFVEERWVEFVAAFGELWGLYVHGFAAMYAVVFDTFLVLGEWIESGLGIK